MNATISLTNKEMMYAAQVGCWRQIENVSKGRKDAYGATLDIGWQANVEGAMCEMAIAKYLGVYWSGMGVLGSADLGVDCQVRGTRHDKGRLPLHPKDDPAHRYYLVTGINGAYTVRGWILGQDGKRDEYWCDPTGKGRPAYFVPQTALQRD